MAGGCRQMQKRMDMISTLKTLRERAAAPGPPLTATRPHHHNQPTLTLTDGRPERAQTVPDYKKRNAAASAQQKGIPRAGGRGGAPLTRPVTRGRRKAPSAARPRRESLDFSALYCDEKRGKEKTTGAPPDFLRPLSPHFTQPFPSFLPVFSHPYIRFFYSPQHV